MKRKRYRRYFRYRKYRPEVEPFIRKVVISCKTPVQLAGAEELLGNAHEKNYITRGEFVTLNRVITNLYYQFQIRGACIWR
jgi:hypothetical protein